MKDELGDRMKKFYEDRYRFYLTRRTPVIIRLDGNAFHTFTKGLEKPFDKDFITIMQKTCKYLCENIQGCVGGYVQSDEISLLLIDYKNLNSDAWFDYNLQKITSLAAARATITFNNLIRQIILDAEDNAKTFEEAYEYNAADEKHALAYKWRDKQGYAIFDARAFNIPEEEVCNYFIWRQKDATRNSINSLAQAHFSHSQLQGKNLSEVQDMLINIGINWNDLPTEQKRGSFIRKYEEFHTNVAERWIIDKNMPILTERRSYIEELI